MAAWKDIFNDPVATATVVLALVAVLQGVILWRQLKLSRQQQELQERMVQIESDRRIEEGTILGHEVMGWSGRRLRNTDWFVTKRWSIAIWNRGHRPEILFDFQIKFISADGGGLTSEVEAMEPRHEDVSHLIDNVPIRIEAQGVHELVVKTTDWPKEGAPHWVFLVCRTTRQSEVFTLEEGAGECPPDAEVVKGIKVRSGVLGYVETLEPPTESPGKDES